MKTFTSSSAKIFQYLSIFGISNIMHIARTKVILMMKNYNESVKMNHNLNCPDIPDHPHRILIIGGSRSVKTKVLLNLIKKLMTRY